MADWSLDGWIWIVILALWMSASGRESTSSELLQQSSLIWTWKENLKLDHWESSGRAAESSEWMQAGTEASRYRWVSGRKSTSSEQMMLWSVGRPDGMARRPDGWNYGQMSVQTGWHVVQTTGREPTSLSCKQYKISRTLLNSGIPVKIIFTNKWFCPIRMRPITN
jgi:hypothetical protein